MDAESIFFFANLGNKSHNPYGGGEIGNRRTIELLQESGFIIIPIRKYDRCEVSNHYLRAAIVFFKMIGCSLKFTSKLLFGNRQNSIVHISGFYGPMVYFENCLVTISHILGYITVYEMRGGGATAFFSAGNVLYKKSFSHIIKRSNCIFSQGKENFELIHTISPLKRVFYYPNFISSDFGPSSCPCKSTNSIRICYFGRITESKNVISILETVHLLVKNHTNVSLDVYGDTTCDNTYYHRLIEYTTNNGIDNVVSFHGPCTHTELKEILKDKNFFIFPSSEPHEGHSNALTEAMAWGLIPIASDHGFSRSVIGKDELIIDTINPQLIANAINSILARNQISELSEYSHNRAMELFSYENVSKSLISEYKDLFSNVLHYR